MPSLALRLPALLLVPAFVALSVRPCDADERTAGDRSIVAAAPGRIEGSQEAVAVGASITGIVEKVTVQQGDVVPAGHVLVRIACREIEAQLATRIAEHAAAEAVHRRLVNGARPEDVDIADADLRLADARVSEAQTRHARSSALVSRNAASQATSDVDERDLRVATAQLEAARLRLRLLKAGTREEEVAEAKARMVAAGHSVEATRSELSKCEVKSPIAGIVLRKHVSEGELVSLFYPRPLVTLSEMRRFRVRAEVDEQDVQRVKQGQRAEVVINSSEQTRLPGRIASIAPVMGRRQILTSDPADKSDRDVMEVIVDLDDDTLENLPIGLRVSVLFLRQEQ
jgi:multidrug resistance efflux pump